MRRLDWIAVGMAVVMTAFGGVVGGMPKLGGVPKPGGPLERRVARGADFDGDELADLAVAGTHSADPATAATGVTVVRYATGRLQHFDNCYPVTSADFNVDGYTDLVVKRQSGLAVIWGRRGGLPSDAGPLDVPVGTPLGVPLGAEDSLASVADFDRDGIPDLVVVSAKAFWILPGGRGPGRVTRLSAQFPGIDRLATGVAADFTGDGHVDLALTTMSGTLEPGSPLGSSWRSGRLMLLRGAASGPGSARFLDPAAGPVVAGDVNGDGRDDLVTLRSLGDHSLQVYLGTPEGLAVPQILGDAGGELAAGDFNGDQLTDVAVSDEHITDGPVRDAHSVITILAGSPRGLGADGELMVGGAWPAGHPMTACDQNGDGRTDLVVTSNDEVPVTPDEQNRYESSPWGDGSRRRAVLRVLPGGASGVSRQPITTLNPQDFNILLLQPEINKSVVC